MTIATALIALYGKHKGDISKLRPDEGLTLLISKKAIELYYEDSQFKFRMATWCQISLLYLVDKGKIPPLVIDPIKERRVSV
jgi:hypothetical protein